MPETKKTPVHDCTACFHFLGRNADGTVCCEPVSGRVEKCNMPFQDDWHTCLRHTEIALALIEIARVARLRVAA